MDGMPVSWIAWAVAIGLTFGIATAKWESIKKFFCPITIGSLVFTIIILVIVYFKYS